MDDKLIFIEDKILQLKKNQEKIHTQQALSFIKEAQKIFEKDFSLDMVLAVLSEAWSTASEDRKEEWRKQGHSFCLLPFHNKYKKTSPLNTTHPQSS
ncbi:MAG: hypothetical protein K2W92_08820 [Alphaproteobacteria bacterium]|nr:hypothetical protein [Alphaproteobacteria bacterium]